MNERRSLFFPMALIGVGVLWLLVNLNIIPAENLWALTHIWPLFLIGLGIGLILRSYWPMAGMLVSALLVVGSILAVVYAGQLGWTGAVGWHMIGTDFLGGVRGSGNLSTETRTINGVRDLDIRIPAEIVITQGTTESLVFEAEDNLLRQISTEVSGGRLTIENFERDWSDRVHPTKPIKITLTLVDLANLDFSSAGTVVIEQFTTERLSINLSGAGDIQVRDLNAQTLECNLSGAGDIDVGGETAELEINISGFGSLDAGDLQAETAIVDISGLGDATVRVSGLLNVDISGAGSLGYYGSPQLIRNVSGLGSIDRKGD